MVRLCGIEPNSKDNCNKVRKFGHMPKKNPFKSLKEKTENLESNVKLAFVFVGLIFLWMLSGLLGHDKEKQNQNILAPLKTVEVYETKSQKYTRFIEITGTSEPYQMVKLAARTETQVEKILHDRGDPVDIGDILLNLDKEERAEAVEAAKFDLKRAQTLYKAASNLNQQGFRANTSLESRRAELAMAKTALKHAKNDLTYTEVSSPIQGVIEERHVEVGDYVKAGDILYDIVSYGKYKIIAHVSQKDRNFVSLKDTAFATLANAQEVSGTITFIATNAHPTTRTYKVEIEVISQEPIPTGMSAKVRIPTKTTTAYLLPYASMVLNDEGLLGAFILDSSNTTNFKTINPIDDNGNGFFLTGLKGDNVEVVVKGQSSLVEGEKVQKILVKELQPINKLF